MGCLNLFSSQITNFITTTGPGGLMAKRFTDTNKWKRPWFRDLGLHAKIVWQYICDDCDHAGIWIADYNLISFQVGFKVDEEKITAWLGDKLVRLEKDKLFIPSFFEFQYKDAKPGFKAKQSAIKELSNYGLIDVNTDSLIDLTNSYLSVARLSKDSHSIGIGKINIIGKGNTGGVGGKTLHWIAELWNAHVESLPKVQSLSQTRQEKIKVRLIERPEKSEWESICKAVEDSDFLSGRDGVWDKCSFDWVIENSNNHVKIFEGNYKNKPKGNIKGKAESGLEAFERSLNHASK